jgi:transketolase
VGRDRVSDDSLFHASLLWTGWVWMGVEARTADGWPAFLGDTMTMAGNEMRTHKGGGHLSAGALEAGSELDLVVVKTIRALTMDAVQKANSGHPGMPMGMAEAAYVLWSRFLKHDPAHPHWEDRDRFILSAGHGSMLLYSLLHLSGYDLPMSQLRDFRQWGSITPGHPEYGLTPGVETTTGPLGQGLANGVGMAIAERFLAQLFNRDGYPIVDHYTYGIVSDGDLMEGISHEAASLAGHLGLGRLVYLYDDNGITIEGSTALAFTEDVTKRFEAYGWLVLEVDGHNMTAVAEALRSARRETERPTLIRCHTIIARGSPNKQGSAAAHGAPLGEEEVRLTKQRMGWPLEPTFLVPQEVYEYFEERRAAWGAEEERWQMLFSEYAAAHPDLADLWKRVMAGELPADWTDHLPRAFKAGEWMATRSASGKVLHALAPHLPTLLGGSADLGPSNQTYLEGYGSIAKGAFGGRNLHFGVREHAMGGILNGLALHGGIIPYGGTFLIFSDYMRPSIRLAAIMQLPVVYVFSHDSIFVGEDGATHQPVEQMAALRDIPGLVVIRPADANETVVAWKVALERRGPVALVLSRQKLPVLDLSTVGNGEGVARGAYVLSSGGLEAPDLLLLASGSEVHVALSAVSELRERGIGARVVSFPSWELFEEQSASYKDTVLPPSVPLRLAVEAAVSQGWERYLGPQGQMIGMERFGASAPYKVLAERFGFTVSSVVSRAEALLRSSGAPAEGATAAAGKTTG